MNAKPILLRIAGWGVFLSFPLLIFPPFKGGTEGSGANGKEHPKPEAGLTPEPRFEKPKPKVAKANPVPKKPYKAVPKQASKPPVKVPPKAIVVPEDPDPKLVRASRPKLVSRVVAVEEKLRQLSTRKVKCTKCEKANVRTLTHRPPLRYQRLKKHLHGRIVRLRSWASPRAIWGSRVYDYEDLIPTAQRWHYGTGTLWIKVVKANGRSGWLPYGYLEN